MPRVQEASVEWSGKTNEFAKANTLTKLKDLDVLGFPSKNAAGAGGDCLVLKDRHRLHGLTAGDALPSILRSMDQDGMRSSGAGARATGAVGALCLALTK